MRSIGNLYWQREHGQALLVSLVATAVGVTASAAVILFLMNSPTTQPDVSSISPRAIVRDISASETKETVKGPPTADTPSRPAGTNEMATQTETEHQPEVNEQETRIHKRVVTRSREPYWRGRFVRAFSQPRFGLW
jgi:hypothetical protein